MENEKMTALIIVDMQNDFITGSLATDPENTLAPRLARYVETMQDGYDVIVTTQDWHKDPGDHWAAEGDDPDFVNTWPVHCAAGTFGAELEEGLARKLNELYQPVQKFYKGQYDASYSGFDGKNAQGDDLASYLRLRMVEEVDVVGIATDFCVKATAEDAVEEGFVTNVLKDYVQGVDADASARLLDTGFNDKNIRVL